MSQLRPLCRGTAPGGVYTTPGQEREVQKDGDPPNARIAAFHPPLICGPPLAKSLLPSNKPLYYFSSILHIQGEILKTNISLSFLLIFFFLVQRSLRGKADFVIWNTDHKLQSENMLKNIFLGNNNIFTDSKRCGLSRFSLKGSSVQYNEKSPSKKTEEKKKKNQIFACAVLEILLFTSVRLPISLPHFHHSVFLALPKIRDYCQALCWIRW